MNLASNVCWAAFETSAITALNTLHGLRHALLEPDVERALGEAIRARRSILAMYALWSRLDACDTPRSPLAELRYFGHLVLAERLHAGAQPINTAIDARLAERASEVALLAMLWKVADALDRVEHDVT